MASSVLSAPSFSTPLPFPSHRPAAAVARRRQRRSAATAVSPLTLAGLLVLLALLVAPEQPADQEAICHRHNGAAVCRVW